MRTVILAVLVTLGSVIGYGQQFSTQDASNKYRFKRSAADVNDTLTVGVGQNLFLYSLVVPRPVASDSIIVCNHAAGTTRDTLGVFTVASTVPSGFTVPINAQMGDTIVTQSVKGSGYTLIYRTRL